MRLIANGTQFSKILVSTVTAIVISCSSVVAYGLNLGTLTLRDAVILALRNNPDVLTSELQRVSDKFAVALAWYDYQVQYQFTGNTSYSDTKAAGIKSYSKSTEFGPQVNYTSTLGTKYTASMSNNLGQDGVYNPQVSVSVEQPLIQGLGRDVVLDKLLTTLEDRRINRMTFRDRITGTILKVVNSYNQVITQVRQLKVQKQQLENQEKSLANIRTYIKAGQKAEFAYVEAKSQLAKSRISIVTDTNAIKSAKFSLLAELGLDPSIKFNVTNKLNLPKIKIPSLKKSIQMALAYSNTYQSLLIKRKADERALLTALDAKRWKLDLTLDASRGVTATGPTLADRGLRALVNGRNTSRSVKLDLTVPLDPLMLKEAIVNAKITLDENAINIASTKRSITTNVINSYRNLKVDKEQIKLSIESVKEQRLVLSNSEKRATYGKTTQFQVNSDRESLITQEIAVVSAENSYENSLEAYSELIGTTLKRWNIKLRY